jgi:hypothetical protein
LHLLLLHEPPADDLVNGRFDEAGADAFALPAAVAEVGDKRLVARSVANLMTIIESLEQKRVGIRILNLGMDTQTPTGKLMLTVLGAVAQFEREMMLERQREGIAKAKSEGRYKVCVRATHVWRLLWG